jgi:nucleotide-binding universal stress UspA family protein
VSGDRKLLIGYDGSENGEDALALGRVLAEVLEADPLVATVMQNPLNVLNAEELEMALDRYATPLLDAARQRLRGFDVEARALSSGSPGFGLHDLAESEDPVALTIGSTHHGPVGRVLLGSVGEALLSGTPCPVAVAPRGYADESEHGLRRIGLAFNGSEESRSALAAAISLAERLDAQLTVLAVAEPPPPSFGTTVAAPTGIDYAAQQHAAMSRALAEVEKRVPAEVVVERRLLSGNPARTITEAAEDFDLLLLGSRCYGPVRSALLGSVSFKLARAAPCPILVVPRGAGADPLGLERHQVVNAADARET